MCPNFSAKALRSRISVWRSGKVQRHIFVQLLFFTSVTLLYIQHLTLRSHVFLQPTIPSPAPPIIAYYNAKKVLQGCSLPNACIKTHHSNRELHLPSVYRSQHALIRRCQNFMTKPEFPKTMAYKLHFYDESYTTLPTSQRHPIDVLGPPLHSTYYSHFAHFAVDFTESGMVPVSFFATKGAKYPMTATCTAPNGTTTPCNARPVDPRIAISALNTEEGSWTAKFMHYIANSTIPPLLYNLPPVKPAPRTCFRSLVTNAVKYDVDYPERDALLRHTGVVRGSAGRRCAPHVVVLSRKPEAARAIPNRLLSDLRAALRAELARSNHNATFEFVQHLSHLSFAGQVALMQRADVLVAAHGAELSNAIFLRRGATVLEIFPFGWVMDLCFMRILDSVRSRRVQLLAPPDRDRFHSCMRRRGRPKSELDVFERHARMYDEASDEAQRFRTTPKFWTLSKAMGECFRYQRIMFDPEQLSRRIVRESKRRCEK